MALARAMILILAGVVATQPCWTFAQETENPIKVPIKGVAKILGFATDVGPPADFVEKSRPSADLDYIPVFQPPPEPAKPAMNDKDLKAMKGELDSVQTQADSVRAAFPPAAKAAADQKAAANRPKTNAPAANQ